MKDAHRMTRADAVRTLSGAPMVHIAAATADGLILRAMHGVVVGDLLTFHGGRTGEKNGLVDQPVAITAEEIVARIPSWMVDPVRACPATTWYRSVHVRGVLEEVLDPEIKAAALQGLMERFQPEGRHAPIRVDDAMYAKAIRSTRVLAVPLQDLVGKSKMGQEKRPVLVNKIVRGLWQRGDPGDLRAIEAIRLAHPGPIAFTDAPDGLIARCAMGPGDAEEAARLVGDLYWNANFSTDQLIRSHQSSHWVGLQDGGVLVATARAVSDVGKRSWIYDVGVAADRRGTGLGRRLMEILLDHPAVRGTEVWLSTRDAMEFYRPLGFEVAHSYMAGTWPRHWMIRPSSIGIASVNSAA